MAETTFLDWAKTKVGEVKKTAYQTLTDTMNAIIPGFDKAQEGVKEQKRRMERGSDVTGKRIGTNR